MLVMLKIMDLIEIFILHSIKIKFIYKFKKYYQCVLIIILLSRIIVIG